MIRHKGINRFVSYKSHKDEPYEYLLEESIETRCL